jgi:hypothetical protein
MAVDQAIITVASGGPLTAGSAHNELGGCDHLDERASASARESSFAHGTWR